MAPRRRSPQSGACCAGSGSASRLPEPILANLRGWIALRCRCRPHWNWPRERGGSARPSATAGDPVPPVPRAGQTPGSGLPRCACPANRGPSCRWSRASLAACLPACPHRCMSARLHGGMLACLHVCLFACLAVCLPLPVASSVGRGHGQLSPLRQDDQT